MSPHSASVDQGLNHLPMSHYKGIMIIWFKVLWKGTNYYLLFFFFFINPKTNNIDNSCTHQLNDLIYLNVLKGVKVILVFSDAAYIYLGAHNRSVGPNC